MSLNKTEKGRSALLDRSHCSDVLERRVLILSDGQRRREHVLELLGANAAPAIDRLLRDGYLMDNAAAPKVALSIVPRTPASADATTRVGAGAPAGAVQTAVPAPPAPAPAPAPAETATATATAAPPRRSLAASKMYMLDMLQLQRDEKSAALKAHIHASPDEAEMVRRLAQALRHMETLVSASYAQRIGERLAETLPEAHLPGLQRARAEYPLEAVA